MLTTNFISSFYLFIHESDSKCTCSVCLHNLSTHLSISTVWLLIFMATNFNGTAKAERESRIVYNLSCLFQCGKKSSLVTRTFLEMIASPLGHALLSSLCICAYVALRIP